MPARIGTRPNQIKILTRLIEKIPLICVRSTLTDNSIQSFHAFTGIKRRYSFKYLKFDKEDEKPLYIKIMTEFKLIQIPPPCFIKNLFRHKRRIRIEGYFCKVSLRMINYFISYKFIR